jgi:hypothetical protein
VKDARPNEFDVLTIPGELLNPNALRMDNDALELGRHFSREHKPVAANLTRAQVHQRPIWFGTQLESGAMEFFFLDGHKAVSSPGD